jgi:hypothetical protein
MRRTTHANCPQIIATNRHRLIIAPIQTRARLNRGVPRGARNDVAVCPERMTRRQRHDLEGDVAHLDPCMGALFRGRLVAVDRPRVDQRRRAPGTTISPISVPSSHLSITRRGYSMRRRWSGRARPAALRASTAQHEARRDVAPGFILTFQRVAQNRFGLVTENLARLVRYRHQRRRHSNQEPKITARNSRRVGGFRNVARRFGQRPPRELNGNILAAWRDPNRGRQLAGSSLEDHSRSRPKHC